MEAVSATDRGGSSGRDPPDREGLGFPDAEAQCGEEPRWGRSCKRGALCTQKLHSRLRTVLTPQFPGHCSSVLTTAQTRGMCSGTPEPCPASGFQAAQSTIVLCRRSLCAHSWLCVVPSLASPQGLRVLEMCVSHCYPAPLKAPDHSRPPTSRAVVPSGMPGNSVCFLLL